MLKDKVIIVTGGNGLLGKEMIYDITKKGGIAICADISLKTDLSLNKLNFDVTSIESIVLNYFFEQQSNRSSSFYNNSSLLGKNSLYKNL